MMRERVEYGEEEHSPSEVTHGGVVGMSIFRVRRDCIALD